MLDAPKGQIRLLCFIYISSFHCLTAADKHAPIVTRRVRGRSVPWLTPEIKDLKHKHDYEHKKAISTNSELHWSNYKRLCNAVDTKMRKEKCNYYSNELSGDQNSKEMWKTLNNVLPNEKKCAISSSPSNLSATKYNEFFSLIARCKEFMRRLQRLCLSSNFTSQS